MSRDFPQKPAPSSPVRRVLVAALMLATALALVVGNPLAWLWVGSVLADSSAPQAGAYIFVAVGLAAGTFLLGHALGALSHAYNHAVGAAAVSRRKAAEPWHTGQRHDPGQRVLTAVLMATIIPAMLGATVWFLFFAGSPLPH